VDSFCPTLLEELTIRVAGVVRVDEATEEVAVDFVVPFVIVLSSDPRLSSTEKFRSS
jgi:hypothetical protein